MKKWIKRIGITLLVLAVGFFILLIWLFQEAFGTKKKTVTIQLDKGSRLICKETYMADMAAVFYDVDFILEKANGDTLYLGEVTFNTEEWQKRVHYRDLSDWHILYANSNFSITNQKSKNRLDTLFSPLELRYDSLWKQKHDDIPSWPYGGSSNIDTLAGQTLRVTYNYRIGDYPPFKFYRQSIDYKIDITTRQIITLKVHDRMETKNGS